MAFDPARAGCGLQRTASSPSSTATHIIGPGYSPAPVSDRTAVSPGAVGHHHHRDGSGGEGGIRTLEGVNPTRFPVARTRPDYATSPGASFRLTRQHLRETRLWRRGWDSNPRGLSHPTRFRDGRTRPGYATPPETAGNGDGRLLVYQARTYICSGALTPISLSVFASTRWQAATNARRACFKAASSDSTLQASLS